MNVVLGGGTLFAGKRVCGDWPLTFVASNRKISNAVL